MVILSAMLYKILKSLRFLEVCSVLIVECSAETAEEEDEVSEHIWEAIVLVVNVLDDGSLIVILA